MRQPGDEAGALIAKIIGPDALSESETRNVLSIVRAAFENPEHIPPESKDPSRTLLLLQNLVAAAADATLKQEIAATVAFLQAQ